MGAYWSRFFGEEDDGEIVQGAKPEMSTPDTRVLNIDPRSPTANIDRTPIEVDKTPGRSGSGRAGSDESPLGRPTTVKEKQRSLHRRIVDKRCGELAASS